MKTKQELLIQLNGIEQNIAARKRELSKINKESMKSKAIEDIKQVLAGLRSARKNTVKELKIYRREERAEKRLKTYSTEGYCYATAAHETDPYQKEYTTKEVFNQMKEYRKLFPKYNWNNNPKRKAWLNNQKQSSFNIEDTVETFNTVKRLLTVERPKKTTTIVSEKTPTVFTKVSKGLTKKLKAMSPTLEQNTARSMTMSRNLAMSNIKQAA